MKEPMRRCPWHLTLPALLAVSAALHAGPGWLPLTAEELAAWLKQPGAPLLLDVRGGRPYRAGTLPDALNAGSDPAGFLPDGRGGPVVLLLGQPPDPAKRQVWVERLRDARHQIFILDGGVPAWRVAGLPVVIPQQSYVRPGTVPFVVPKGLCEGDEPAQEFR